MNRIHKRRLMMLTLFIIGMTLATSLILYALNQNMNAFLTPHQLVNKNISKDYHLRLGGLIKPGSVMRDKNGLGVQFIVTDFKSDILVRYVGVLPDLFREGKGVVAEGNLTANQVLLATQILAKHDENYMPKNVYQALKESA